MITLMLILINLLFWMISISRDTPIIKKMHWEDLFSFFLYIVEQLANNNMLRQVSNFFSRINEVIGKSTAWLTTLLMLLICYNVLMRYLFNNSEAWRTELEWHIFGLIFLLGAGYALKHDKHVRVDVFYAKFSEKKKAFVNFTGTLVFLIPWCIVIILNSFKFAYKYSYLKNEGSPDNGLPALYLIKFAITVGFVLLLFQAISMLIDSGMTLFGKEKKEVV